MLGALLKLKCLTACGPDGLSSIFFHKVAYTVVQPLASIFEVSFRTSCLPTEWLVANVSPILKKGDARDPCNH